MYDYYTFDLYPNKYKNNIYSCIVNFKFIPFVLHKKTHLK